MSLEVMANPPWSGRNKLVGPGGSLKITPSNSPILRPSARSPQKPPPQSTLSLQTVIGTTTSTPNGFSCHEPSRSFALCVGSAAILAEIEFDGTVNQRFFRARPTASAINPVTSFYNPLSAPSTPDNRSRSTLTGRSNSSLYGATTPVDWADANGSRTWTSRERIKAVTSVAISPNGRFLATGETGYNPRVLIFSTARDSPRDVPLTIITEHSFGVRSLAFSSNSQFLATLGDVNDGFLFVWAISLKNGAAKLHSTNKCTSFIRDMCWMGQTLITVGVRHVKVWRLSDTTPGSPSKSRQNLDAYTNSPGTAPKALSGRNCILGPLGETTFTCISSISDSEAIICAENGALCFLDDTAGSQKLTCVKMLGFSITSMTVDTNSDTVWVGGPGKRTQKLQIEELRPNTSSSIPQSPPSETEGLKSKSPSIVSMGFLASHIVTVDSTRAIHLFPVDALSSIEDQTLPDSVMPAHRDPVLGVGVLQQPNLFDADFFTWSCEGSVRFWTLQGKCQALKKIELEQLPANDDDVLNELKVLRAAENMDFFVSGDRYGVVRLLSPSSWKCQNEVRAHGGEVTDIAISSVSGNTLVATAGRDRMVQLFKKDDEAFELIQTMDEHVGAVGRLLFMNDGERLLSSSADRTVIVRERVTREVDGRVVVAFLMAKVITLKVSPVSMTVTPDDPDILVLSTIDRYIQRYDISSGRHIHSFRASDPETSDSVVMSSLTVCCEISGQSPRLLVGLSGTDKSIRTYDFEKDVLLTREFGHSEGVSDVALLETKVPDSKTEVKRTLISTGLDGVVMIWDLSVQQPQPQELAQTNVREEDETPMKELTVSKPPLRRILSKTELAGFQRPDGLAATPTPLRDLSPPRVRRKTSRMSLAPSANRNGNANGAETSNYFSSTYSSLRRSPIPSLPMDGSQRRSPSPPSPRSKFSRSLNASESISNLRRASTDIRSAMKNSSSGTSEFGSLNMSTEQVCRTLRAYRKKLVGSTEYPRIAKELERELQVTIQALNDRAAKIQQQGDTETDSSGKENERKPSPRNLIPPPVPSTVKKPSMIARRVPSTPLLKQKEPRKVSRSRSFDADGEG